MPRARPDRWDQPNQARWGRLVRLHAIITGQVQGVGFRYFVVSEAGQLGLSGYVRNVGVKQVEVVAEGERQQLEQLAEAVRAGPTGARVQHVQLSWGETDRTLPGFTIRPSE